MDDRQNFDPTYWGPPGWTFLFAVADGYPQTAGYEQKVHMANFIASLGYLLPCASCRRSYTEFTMMYPPINSVGGRTQVRRWFEAYKKYASRLR